MSQASHKSRTMTSLTLNNPVKPIAKTKSDRASVDETESNQKSKDVVSKDTKDNSKLNNEEKHPMKKDKSATVEEETKTEKNASKNDDKLKNGSSNNSEDSNKKISNGSHKSEESTTEEKPIRETRQKSAAVKETKSEDVEPTNDSKSDKTEKSAENPVVNKEKDKEKDTTKSNQKDKKQDKDEKQPAKDKEKDKDTSKSNQKDKKQDKDDKQPGTKDTPRKDTKDGKSSSSSSRTASPSGKDNKETTKSKLSVSPKPKSKPDLTPPKSKKSEEKLDKPTEASPQKDNKSRPIRYSQVWDNEEMEPLMMQVDVEEKIPLKQSPPPSTSTPTQSGRVLRMRSSLPERNSPLSLYNIDDPKNNTSTCVNLSTLTNPHSPNKSYSAKVRSVSGRRPMLREMSYQNSYRDQNRQNISYSSSTAINESVSSGYLDQSQRSVNTSSFVARKRYIEENLVEEIGSPKRPRLDLSSLLTLVSSPVTMLRNRLARARIQCSTPNSKSDIKDDIQIDTVTASCIDEPKDSDVEEAEEDVERNEMGEHDDDADMKQLPDSAEFTNAPIEMEFHTDIHIKILKEENKIDSSPFVPNDAIKKKWNCSLM